MPARQRKKKTAEPKPPKEKLITRSTIMSDYGWTATLIKKYLPPPQLKTNPNYHTAAPMQLWPESLVLETMMTPEFQTDFLKLQDSRNVQKQREEEKKQRVRDVLMQYDLNALILKARTLDRHFVLHYGPTNSGKTYQSIEALKKARSGVYLGPLRLLALEVFDTLNDAGVACSLLTGEESIEVPSAGITASTIEMLNTNRRYDVAVIDEAQLIANRDRGGAWTKAILAVNAKEVHLCFAPEALDFYKLLLHDCETDYEVVEHKRLTPLVYSGSIKALSCVVAQYLGDIREKVPCQSKRHLWCAAACVPPRRDSEIRVWPNERCGGDRRHRYGRESPHQAHHLLRNDKIRRY